jgi:F-type H+-transporting ATPase subunit b
MNEMMQSHPVLQDPMLWYAVAFAVFCVLAWVYVRKPLLGVLDAEIFKIRDQIDNARKLRAEAEATLAEYKKKSAAAMKEAQEIITYASEEAEEVKQQAEADLKAALARHEQQATDRIRVAEAEAVAAVRAAAVDQAMVLARKALTSESSKAGALADQAIAELPKLAAAKAKAA